MPRTTTALTQAQHYLEVLRSIPRHRYASTNEIQNSLALRGIEINTLTLQRYLKQLTDSGTVPIECNKKTKPFGYKLGPGCDALLFTKFSPQEALLLRLVEENLKYLLPAKITKGLDPFFDQAKRCLADGSEGRTKAEVEWLKKISVVAGSLPRIPPNIKPRIFETISEALYSNKMLNLHYQNVEGHEKVKHINPLGLVQQDGRLYLVCQFEGYTNFRHLALHRILNAELLDLNAPKVPGFDVHDYVKSIHFNYSGDEPKMVHLVLEFTNEQTFVQLTESPFKRDQVLTKLPNGHYRLEVDIEDSILLDGWIKTWEQLAGIVLVEKTPL